MKRYGLIALALCLLVTVAVGCAPESEEDQFSVEATTNQMDLDAQTNIIPEEKDAQKELMENYAAHKDELFEGMDGAFTASARVEDTLFVYTYVFYDPSLSRDGLRDMFEKMCLEGSMIVAESQAAAPGFTGAAIQFLDADGEILERREFY